MGRLPAAFAFAVLAAAPALLAGCSSPEDGPVGTIVGTATVGPTCPVEQEPPDPQCADRPYEGELVVATADGSREVGRFPTNPDGTFQVSVAPGSYTIRSPEGQQLPYCSTQEPVVVEEGRTTKADVSCDSGIR